MGFDRRNFLKTLGVAGFTFTAGKSFGVTKKEKSNIEFFGILYEPGNLMHQSGTDYRKALEIMKDHIVH